VQLARAAAPKAARVTVPGSSTSTYCQARGRLEPALIHEAATAIARRMDTRARPEDRWLDRAVKLLDGTGVRTDDNAECREDFGTSTGQKPGCGFPVIKLCALFSLTTGAWLAGEPGRTCDHDLPTSLPLLQNHLHKGDVLAADHAFSAWWLMALAVARGADCVLRLHQAHRADFRRGRRPGPGERLLTWPPPAP